MFWIQILVVGICSMCEMLGNEEQGSQKRHRGLQEQQRQKGDGEENTKAAWLLRSQILNRIDKTRALNLKHKLQYEMIYISPSTWLYYCDKDEIDILYG